MTNEEEVEGSERMLLAERAIAHRSAVMPLLRQLAPQALESDLDAACSEVVSAIMSYELRSRMAQAESLQTKRRDLARMRKTLQECLHVLEPEPRRFGALRRMQAAQLNQKGVKGGVRELRRHLDSAIAACDAALEELKKMPGHGADGDLAELAAMLRWTLAKTLGLKPAMQRDRRLKSVNPEESGNYSRLLRLGMTLAGSEPPDDLHHIMKRGREHLRDHGVAISELFVSDDYPEGVYVLGSGKFDTK